METQKSTLTCAKSFLAVGLIYAPSGALGEGTVELEDRVFPTSPPAFDRGFAGVSNDSGCRIRRTAFLSLGRWVV